MLKWLLKAVVGDTTEKRVKEAFTQVQKINELEPALEKKGDGDLRQESDRLREKIQKGESLDNILPHAFALVREASKRTIGLRHFDVQLVGGIILHQGAIAEMKTGEGKTLVATLPAYLNGITGQGVHIVTVNDYLAKRDRNWMGPVFEMLGLSVGLIQNSSETMERREAYGADITYGTNNEFGFDYLRDHMSLSPEQCVQRELNYAIVDEVDSILIDEARTPLIISGMVEEDIQDYYRANDCARRLNTETDFKPDSKTKNVVLTEIGIKKVERLLKMDYLYDLQHMEFAHQLIQALKAWHLYKRDVDYVVKEGEIIIVDEFTGRLMIGRRYSDGLHQAIEAKEAVEIKQESQTLATITFQNYFRLYQKLAGMTGTAKTQEEEFWKVYKLEVALIPTHKPMIRKDLADVVYKNQKAKFKAVADEIEQLHALGRPALVGTISIENSELLSEILRRRRIPHHVLNAKHHEKEAEIVAQAGQRGGVTIATNMAGRGTDIVLGEGVADMGGLHIIGTERHESRRIDNQLRGRSGRQGDMGSSRFYVSLEDDLMKHFGSQRISGLMDRLGLPEETPIEHGMVTRAIENAQGKVEQYYTSIRKQVLEFDDVMNKQRETIYELRTRILRGQKIEEKFREMISTLGEEIVQEHLPEKGGGESEKETFLATVSELGVPADLLHLNLPENSRAAWTANLRQAFAKAYEQKISIIGEPALEILRQVMLRVLDGKWIDQLLTMDTLREGIGLRAYGQRDPLVEYKMEAFSAFTAMMRAAREEIFSLFLKLQVLAPGQRPPIAQPMDWSGGEEEEGSLAGPVPAKRKVGRNDPCPCGSGTKYKKCHGKAE